MKRWIVVVVLLGSLCAIVQAGRGRLRAQLSGSKPQQQRPPAEAKPLKLPDWWKADDPLPQEKTNCVRCHLTAGRELTTPVRDFARSVHDRTGLSCNDCHGGN